MLKKVFTILIALWSTTVMAQAQFTVTSTDFKDGEFLPLEQVYNGYGCTGKNISPQLSWSNPPAETKSFAVISHDPDAPVQNGWYHWIVANIPVTQTSLKKGEEILPPLTLGFNSFNTVKYGGPCPPVGHGKHRYIFTVYALNTKNVLIGDVFKPEKIEEIIKKHSIGSASITGYFERK